MNTISTTLAERSPTCTYQPPGTRTNRRFDDGMCGALATHRYRRHGDLPWSYACTTDAYRLDRTVYQVEELEP